MSEVTVDSKSPRRHPVFVFFESVFSLALLTIMIIGLVTVTVTWERSRVEFVGSDRIRITRTTWWGAAEVVSVYRAGERGWLLEGADGQEQMISAMPVVLDR